MSNNKLVKQFWRQNYADSLQDKSGWLKFSEAFQRYRIFAMDNDMTAAKFHSISHYLVKATRYKNMSGCGERCYRVKSKLNRTPNEGDKVPNECRLVVDRLVNKVILIYWSHSLLLILNSRVVGSRDSGDLGFCCSLTPIDNTYDINGLFGSP